MRYSGGMRGAGGDSELSARFGRQWDAGKSVTEDAKGGEDEVSHFRLDFAANARHQKEVKVTSGPRG